MSRATQKDLVRVVSQEQKTLRHFKEGAYLVQRTGYSIDQLVAKATVDRVQLGVCFEKQASRLLQMQPPSYRLAIGRAYYALYQSFRAVVFFVTAGDDHEKHSELPKHLPADFPTAGHWESVLKDARLARNRADYDPYPREDQKFEADARAHVGHAVALRPVVRAYLRGKGVVL